MIITYFARERFKCNASVIPALMILQKQNPLLDGVAQCLQIVYMTDTVQVLTVPAIDSGIFHSTAVPG